MGTVVTTRDMDPVPGLRTAMLFFLLLATLISITTASVGQIHCDKETVKNGKKLGMGHRMKHMDYECLKSGKVICHGWEFDCSGCQKMGQLHSGSQTINSGKKKDIGLGGLPFKCEKSLCDSKETKWSGDVGRGSKHTFSEKKCKEEGKTIEAMRVMGATKTAHGHKHGHKHGHGKKHKKHKGKKVKKHTKKHKHKRTHRHKHKRRH